MKRALRTHVIGVGCGAGRAMNPLCTMSLPGVTCVAVNTDREVLQACRAPTKILLERTDGRDASGHLATGRWAAVAAYDQLVEAVQEADVVILIVGLGGGTGSGAAPVKADIAKQYGCLTVAVVTLPFRLEGQRRLATAEQGRQELQPEVDTLLTIPLQRLLSSAGGQTSLGAAYRYGDAVVRHTVYSVLEALTCADARALFARTGLAYMGSGVARGEHRGVTAARQAVNSHLFEPCALAKAQAVLLSLTGGPDLTLREVNDAASVVREMTLAEVFITQADVLDRRRWGLADRPQADLWVTLLAA